MPFEIFNERAAPRGRREPTVTLNSKGILVNKAARDLIPGQKVVLAYDRERHRLGIKPAEGDLPYAYNMSRNGLIGARSYYAHYGLAVTGKHVLKAYKDGPFLAVDLPAEIEAAARDRKG